jgi:hypothetical protein
LKPATGIALCLTALAAVSCRTAPPPAAADFSAAGWHVRQGEAVWKPGRNRPELAGELMAAANQDGDFFVQLAKTPFALATARQADGIWRIEFGAGGYTRGGRGAPPARFVWFELPRFLAGEPLEEGWRSETRPGQRWRLENLRTGESLEGFLSP